jgi:5-methylcytosine-specific restriction endonuclease McrA
MTKDHILAKSKGGVDELANYQTMCSTCNNLKGACDLELDDVKELRRLYDNQEKIPRKELRDLINKRREEMAKAI